MNPLRIGDLEVKVPIVQGGMGVAVSLSGLASAVANEGGIGVISAAGIGMREPDYIKNFREANIRGMQKEIRKTRSLTDGVIGMNIMLALTDHEDLILTSIREKIDVIIMGAGLPLRIPGLIAGAGLEKHHTKLIVKVSSAKATKLIFNHWSSRFGYVPDAVVLEGSLAGGHLGFKKEEIYSQSKSLSTLAEEIIKEIAPFEKKYGREIPLIAGGGIYTGKDIYDIMQTGVKAVKMGTRFVTTFECDASQSFKDSYLSSREEDIVIIDSPVGLPGRVIKNKFVEEIMQGHTKPFKCPWKCLTSCNFQEAPYCIAQVLYNSAQGKMDEGFAFAGSNAFRATKIQHVSEIFDELISEYNHEAEKSQPVPVCC